MSPARTATSLRGPSHFRIVHCSPARFFGLQTFRRREEVVSVSDPERTVIDMLDRPEYSGGLPGAAAALARAKPRLDWSRLERYLRKLQNRSLTLRLGYLIERVRPDLPVPPATVGRLLPRAFDPYVPLGPTREFGRGGRRDGRWHEIRNVLDEHVFGEVNVR